MTNNQQPSPIALELMGVIKLRENKKGAAVVLPSEIFACLLGMGYQRPNEKLDIQQRAKEFVTTVRQLLVRTKAKSPSYDQIIHVMNQLGYVRATAVSSS